MKTTGIFTLFLVPYALMAQIKYPATKTNTVSDNYFGTEISDPYRWLENDTAADVADWVKAENNVTNQYLEKIPYRSQIKKRLTQTWNYPKYSAPFKKGDYYFYYYNNGLQNQAILFVQKGINGTAEVFIDPNTLSPDGTVSLGNLSFSHDNKYCAFSISKSGSDWQEIYIKEVATGTLTTDTILWTKFGSVAWHGSGFYYSRYPEPVKGLEYSAASQQQKVYYHILGTKQQQDKLIYEDPEHPKRYMWPGVTDDEKYLIIGLSEGTSGNGYLVSKLSDAKPVFKELFKGFENNYDIVDHYNGRFLVRTDFNAPNYRLVWVNPDNPMPETWVECIAQKPNLLSSVNLTGHKIIANYLENVSSRIYQFSINGDMEKQIELPGLGTAAGFGGEADDTETFYTFSSFAVPPTIYRYDLANGHSELFRKTEYPVNLDDIETHQVFYTSKDGTMIPMFMIYKKGIQQNGNNPTMLYGYGGFNISLTPSFNPANLVFIENGGIYCIANLRGGGEYGEDWHKAGMLEKKQTVFDDFISAAEYLIAEKYTSSQKLAISGRSNGGLLVGACMTQRPELYKVALPGVGVLDMLRYHKFTVGWGWAVEYGSSDYQEQFNYLIKYSPLHNLKKGTNYPATLITTADHDDRVVPAHSFKFAANLQNCHKGPNPVLIRIDEKAGHGAGKPIGKLIDEQADVWSFVFYNLGMKPKN